MSDELFLLEDSPKNTPPVIEFVSDDIDEELNRLSRHTEPENKTDFITDIQTDNEEQKPDFEAKKVFNEGNPQTLNIGSLLSADMSVDLLNVLLPVILCYVIKLATGKEASKRQFEATQSEKEIIAPALQNYLNSINFTVESPFNALLITLSIVYGSKTVEVITDNKKGTIKPDFIAPDVRERVNPETRGRHRKDCQCSKCLNKKR